MIKKILVLRFSSIGDIVLTTPVLRCLKTQKPDLEIHYATKIQYQSVLSANPFISKIHTLEHSDSMLIQNLKRENFDCIIDLHHNLRTYKIKRALKIKSFAFKKLNIEKWLLVNFKINKLPHIHIVDRYLKTVENLGVVNDGKGLDYFIPEQAIVNITSLPNQFHKHYSCVVIGAMHATKKLPLHKLIELVNKIQGPIILIGGKEDMNEGEIVASTAPERIYNACGKYSINQSASIIQQAEKIITHDTGMMHIAAAFNKHIISIWGNTIPEFGMYQYYGTETTIEDLRTQKQILEISNLSCRPCSKIGYAQCPKGHFNCMNKISFESIG